MMKRQQSLEELLGQNPDRDIYRYYAFVLAFIKGDQEGISKHLDWFATKPDEPDFTDNNSIIAGFSGQWKKSLDLTRRSIAIYVRSDRKENAAQAESANGVFESQFGLCQQAKESVSRSLALYQARSNKGMSAVALSLCSDPQGSQLADELQKRYPKDTFVNFYAIPMSRAQPLK